MKSYGKRDVGCVRVENQDNYYCRDKALGMFDNLYIVADGMGGHKGGAYASTYVVNKTVEHAEKSNGWDIVAFFTNVLKQLNNELLAKGREMSEYAGMGTTAVMATEKNGKLYAFNVGDSRLYLMHEGSLKQISEDHSYVQELVAAGLVGAEEARVHPKRNIITRAVGAPQSLEVDHFIVDLADGDLILLCSDGLHGMVNDAEIEALLKGNGSLEEKNNRLIELAKEHGGNDNIAVVLASYGKEGEGAC